MRPGADRTVLGTDMTSKVALFSLDRALYAVPVAGILQIVSEVRTFELPLLRTGVRAVFLYQDKVVPLLSRRLIGGSAESTAEEGDAAALAVVYSTDLGPVGLPADKILGVVERRRGREEEAEEGEDNAQVSGRVFVCNGDRYPLLEVETLAMSLPQ